jgi:serum/glucocorticoid-regulated kinase 2
VCVGYLLVADFGLAKIV